MTRPRLWAVLIANLALVGLLAGSGVVAHSLGVWSEGVDYLGDVGGIAAVLVALWLERRPRGPARPNGYPRATGYAALANSAWLALVSLAVAGSAAARLVSGAKHVQGLVVLVVSGVAALVMGASAIALRSGRPKAGDPVPPAPLFQRESPFSPGAQGRELSFSAVMLDTLGDAAAAACVATSGAVMYATGGAYWLDPVSALAVSAAVTYQAVRLLTRTAAYLRCNGAKVT